MKHLSQFLLFALLVTGCTQQKPDPRDVPFLAEGEQAIVGSYTLDSVDVRKELVCTLDVLTNHTFVISNLPAGESSKTISLAGTWSMTVIHVWDARRYYISFAGITNLDLVRARFPNAELPDKPAVLSLLVKREGQIVDYRFKQLQSTTPLPPPR